MTRCPCPTEHAEQVALMQWARIQAKRYPGLDLLHAIPNGGARNAITGAKLKAEGVKPGVPDLHLPVPLHGRPGLYLELKRKAGSAVTPAQREWHAALAAQGYAVVVCRGARDAIEAIEAYYRDGCATRHAAIATEAGQGSTKGTRGTQRSARMASASEKAVFARKKAMCESAQEEGAECPR